METGPQQIMLNEDYCKTSNENWSSDGENENDIQPRRKSANSRKNVHFR